MMHGKHTNKKKWISKAIKHPGSLHEALGIPMGKNIPKGKLRKAAKAKGKLGFKARLAERLEKMPKRGGKRKRR